MLANAVLPGEHAEAVRRAALRDAAWVAPSLWRVELRNVLATTMRLRGLTLERAVAAFEEAERLVEDVGVEPSAADCLELARRGGVSAYDAELVAVAERLDLLLVTGDRKLARAFPDRARSIEAFAAGE